MALTKLLEEPAHQGFVRAGSNGVPAIDPAALEAAALCDIRWEGGFDPEAFLKIVRERREKSEL
ncbi:MAG: hypothetical protein ACO1SV_03315 [Fimbriimonas sp.]